jgi:hypothetical protein
MKLSLTYLRKAALGLAVAAVLAIPVASFPRSEASIAHLAVPAPALIADGTETHGLVPPPTLPA